MKRYFTWVVAFSMGGACGWGAHQPTEGTPVAHYRPVQREWQSRMERARVEADRNPNDWDCAARYALLLETYGNAKRNTETDFGDLPQLAEPKPEEAIPLVARLERLAAGDPRRERQARSFQYWVSSP